MSDPTLTYIRKYLIISNLKLKLFYLATSVCLIPFTGLFAQENPPETREEYEKIYAERIKKERINGVYIPKNLEDALTQLDAKISPESKNKFKSIPEDTVCALMHGRLGQWIMLNWSFYEGSRLSHYLRSAGITYPDDMADFLILAYHRQLNGRPFVIKDMALSFHEKRKKEFEKEKKEGKVIFEETKPKTKPLTKTKPAIPKGGG